MAWRGSSIYPFSGHIRLSAGRAVDPPSDAAQRFIDAHGSDVGPNSSLLALRAILAAFADRPPVGEPDQLTSHFPADVRALVTPARRIRREAPPRR